MNCRYHQMSAAAKTGRSLSGLQKEVLALYRTILRTAWDKDKKANHNDSLNFLQALTKGESATTAVTSLGYAKTEFRRQAAQLRKNDFRTIEFKIRHGYKQVKLLQMPGVKVVGGKHSKQ